MRDGTDFVELARIWRGPLVESVHRGTVVVADFEGRLVGSWGDAGLMTFPRSSLKPFQAMALVESGAADAFGLSDEYIAMACASHDAEPFQTGLVGNWLGRLGLTEEALVCGPALPRREDDMATAFAQGGPRRLYHNCSGKHCGFLTVAKHLGAGLDYARPDHPAQKLYLDILSDYLGRDATKLPVGRDGCGLPTLALPMRDLSRAAARLGLGYSGNAARRAAAKRVLGAMTAYPDHLSGLDSPTARIVRATGGRVAVKGGAEGFVMAVVPDRGLGITIKIADGAARAKYGVLARTLGHFGVLPTAEAEALVESVNGQITDSTGAVVGGTEIVFETPVPTSETKATLGFWLGGVKEAFF
ncbi:asparaginase [Falsiroseomonas selenitidurans]|uniref:Asparaginase n=1 Tax=Falsiroseomonas selenitidurans TaxID=2716335 RepID=A0ABX1E9Q6_9PROT|nr:asparaginase [Falsiroseomonas selenitidurans]NKC32513.1 asparaginase [Falsiroseomonas selenitidurans]